MHQNSTLFFFYDNTQLKNELVRSEDFLDSYDPFREELESLFAGLEVSPGNELIKKILAVTM